MSLHAAPATEARRGLAGFGAAGPALNAADFRRIAGAIRREAGIDLSDAKVSLVHGRLARRVEELGLSAFRDYCDLIEAPEGADERRVMVEALTTNYTFFFREPHHFEDLAGAVLPDLAERARAGGRVRIWSAGCSAGPEPYSIAMTLLGAIPEAGALDIRILATDIDRSMVAKGGAGIYEDSMLEAVSPALRSRWFRAGPEAGLLAVDDELKRIVTFRELNLLGDWPMKGDFDVVFCRNVTIYFDADTREGLWSRIARRVVPGGTLYAGHSERIVGPALASFTHAGVTTYRRRAAT
jgi:chemotaxis protein methyltransferase CheR